MLTNLVHGLTVLGNGPSIIYLVAGSIGGMVFGVIPGLGGVVILSVVLALINHISLEGTLCFFLAVQAASFFSASITSILLNTPAHAEAFAVTFDGFPMAQRGEAGRALGISATSTCVGGLIGCAALVGFIQILNSVSIAFHPPEYVALVVLALILVGTLGTDSVSKGLISAGMGIMLASVGPSGITGADRYTFNSDGLLTGISLVALALGCFAIPQMMMVFGTSTTVARQDMTGRDVTDTTPVELGRGFASQVVQGIGDTFRHWFVLILSAFVGVVTGIIPGIGAFAANFLSYGLAQQTSRRRKLFGTGIPEGIIAPEGSSLSKEAGGIIPVIGLGIPSGVGGALFLAALDSKGIRVGYNFTTTYPVLPYEIVWIIALGGLIGTVAGLLAAPMLAWITRVPGPLLVPFILALSIFGTFIATQSFFCVMECLIFGIVGLAMRRLRYSLASFVVGLVLGPTFEANFFLTHNIYHGISFLKLPLTDVIFALILAFLLAKAVQIRHDRATVAKSAGTGTSAEEVRRRELQRHPYPLLSLIVTTVLLGLSIFFVVYGATQYSFVTAVMPVFGGILVSATALFRFPLEVRNFVRHVRLGRGAATPAAVAVTSPQPVSVGGVPESTDTVAGLESALFGSLQLSSADDAPRALIAPPGFANIIERAWGRHGQYTREIVCLGWLVLLIAASFLVGFSYGAALFAVAYSLTATRRVLRTWHGRVIFAAVSAATLYVMTWEITNLLHLLFTPVI